MQSRPEVTVVVDVTQTDLTGIPLEDWGIPVEVPVAVLQDLADTAETHSDGRRPAGSCWHARGVSNLGRTCRVASQAHRGAYVGVAGVRPWHPLR